MFEGEQTATRVIKQVYILKSTVCTKNGQCLAFGDNEFGQLGIKGLNMSYEPLRAHELESHHILYVACGARHSAVLSGESRTLGEPLTPSSDQSRISPYNINTISSRQVMGVKKNISWGLLVDLIPSSQH